MFKKLYKKKHDDELNAIVYATDTQELIEKMKKKYRLTPDSFGGFAACFPKKKFNIDEWQGKYVMHCENQEELFKFYDYLHSVGRKWSMGESYSDFRPTKSCTGPTRYIYFNEGQHGGHHYNRYTLINFKDFDWSDFDMRKTKIFYIGDKVRQRGSNLEYVVVGTYTPGGSDVPTTYKLKNTKSGLILTKYHYELELIERKSFTKEDLEPGMVVEYRNGDKALYVNDYFMEHRTFMNIGRFYNDLIFTGADSSDRDYDICKVYTSEATTFNTILRDTYLNLIWERKEEEPVKEMTVSEIEEKLGFKVKVIADKE